MNGHPAWEVVLLAMQSGGELLYRPLAGEYRLWVGGRHRRVMYLTGQKLIVNGLIKVRSGTNQYVLTERGKAWQG